MAFELWEDDEFLDKPFWIRLSKNGNIVLSKALKDQLGNYIQIAFDKKAKIIQFKPVAENEKGARYIEKTKIQAKSLIEKLGIKIEEAERHEAVYDEKQQVYFAKLN